MTGRPMATADDALNVARAQLGNGPDLYRAWYPAGDVAWCCIFQSWVLTQVGLPTHYAWVSGLFDAMRAQGRTAAPFLAQPGDLVAFDYDGGGPSNYDHIAMVESVDVASNTVVCIDGNWQNRVQRVRRTLVGGSGYSGGVAEIARPFYTPNPSPEEDEMKSVLLVDRRQSPAPVWHAFGNTKVHLTSQEQVDTIAFLGAEKIDPAPPAWIDALATLPRG